MNEAILGAVLALSGVLLTLIATPLLDWWRDTLRQRAAKKERELQMKRDAYFPLVCAFTEGMGLLGRILAVPPDKIADIRLSRESENALAIKDLVSSGAVLEKTAEASKAMSVAIARLVAYKGQESLIAIDLENVSTRIDQLNKNNEEILARTESASKPDPAYLVRLHERFRVNQEELEGLFRRQRSLLEARSAILQEIAKQQFVEIASVAETALPALIALRKDLGVPTDEEHLRELFQVNHADVGKSVKGVVDGFWEMLHERMDKD